MPESSLAVAYDYIRQRVGQLRGYRMAMEDWSDREKELIEICLRDGSAMFYTQAHYEWSFLTPLVTLTLTSGTDEVELPWDFGFAVDQTIYFDDNVGRNLRIVNDGLVLLRRQNLANVSSRPEIAAVVVEGKVGTITGAKSKLIFWPTASETFTVSFRYSLLADALSVKTPTPYGGAAHSQTIIEACLAASERLDGNPQGPHNLLYAQALEESKVHDRRIKPRALGKPRNGKWQPMNVNPVVYTGS